MAKGVRKTFLLTTILFTSMCWISLDFYLLYYFGIITVNSVNMNDKLPTDDSNLNIVKKEIEDTGSLKERNKFGDFHFQENKELVNNVKNNNDDFDDDENRPEADNGWDLFEKNKSNKKIEEAKMRQNNGKHFLEDEGRLNFDRSKQNKLGGKLVMEQRDNRIENQNDPDEESDAKFNFDSMKHIQKKHQAIAQHRDRLNMKQEVPEKLKRELVEHIVRHRDKIEPWAVQEANKHLLQKHMDSLKSKQPVAADDKKERSHLLGILRQRLGNRGVNNPEANVEIHGREIKHEEKIDQPDIVHVPLNNRKRQVIESQVQQQNANIAPPDAVAEPAKPAESSPKPVFEKVRDLDKSSQPRDPKAPGEGGAAYFTNKSDRRVQAGWKHASFNEFASDQISVERSVNDVRKPACREKEYAYNVMPKTSVIICFTEESWSTLLRTIHSVLNRTPPELLEEILLVDDFSQREYLKEPLDKYLEQLAKVRIMRLEKREGLIRARLRGAAVAKGPVLTFLDSHVECNKGWIEPLIDRIWRNPRTVVTPIIDMIDSNSFSYSGSPDTIRGVFDWNLMFKWGSVPSAELSKRVDPTSVIKSPTMAGGLFSMLKSYFYELGAYDPGFEIWGAENLELSFKVWMCGGRLEIAPCSHVGHIFRTTQPYKFPGGNVKTFLRNCVRLAESWLDEYKEHFYMMRPNLRGQSFGDVSGRLAMRKRLGCKSFQWYLENVIPELHIPQTKVQAKGELRNKASGLCADSMRSGRLDTFVCHGHGGTQSFQLTKEGILQNNNKCVGKYQTGRVLMMLQCSASLSVKWTHEKSGALRDTKTGACLDVTPGEILGKHQISLQSCDPESPKQQWEFSHYFNNKGIEIK